MFAFWSYWGPGTAGGAEFAWAVSSTLVILHVEVADDGKVEVEVAPCDMSTLHCIPLSTAKETSLDASGECRACGVSSVAADENVSLESESGRNTRMAAPLSSDAQRCDHRIL